MSEDADIDEAQLALFKKVELDGFCDLRERIAASARPAFNKLEAVDSSASPVTPFQGKSNDSKNGRGCKTSAGTIEAWLVKNGVIRIPKVKPVIKRIVKKSKPSMSFANYCIWHVANCPQQYSWIHGREAYDGFTKYITARTCTQDTNIPYDLRRSFGRQQWANLPPSEKCRWMLAARNGYIDALLPESDENCQMVPGVREADFTDGNKKLLGALITYNGDWGHGDQKVCAIVDGSFSSEKKTEMLSKCGVFEDLADDFFDWMVRAGFVMGLPRVSISVEHSLHACVDGRVHLHCYLSGTGVKTSMGDFLQGLYFRGLRPSHISLTTVQRWGKRETRACEGHYYLQFPKNGSLIRKSNYQSAVDFVIHRKWIITQLGQNKMTLEVAMSEAIRSHQGVRGAMQEFQFQMSLVVKKQQEEESERIKEAIRRAARPFKQPTAQISKWMNQYDMDWENPKTRFKVLVLDGPSRMGKTSWAKSFFGEDQTLVLNCQGVTTPCFGQYSLSPGKYKCILFEEGNWELIFKNKLIFQAGPEMIQVGQSPTMQFVQYILLYNKAMIMTTNDFWETVEDDKIRAYLEANIVYETVHEQCFL